MIDALKTQLIKHEGLRFKPYLDSVGVLTIGVGRNLHDKGISKAEALHLLDNDILGTLADLDAKLPWWRDMAEARQLVLADMAFNLGITRLLTFKNALAAMKAGDYPAAADGMLASLWAQQVGTRAHTLAKMMRDG